MFLIILRPKKMCKHAVKKLPYLLRYVLFKTQKMCDGAILENGGTLKSVPCIYNIIDISKRIDLAKSNDSK